MGLGHSPRIVTDGLVLALDAGNPKNYNALVSSTNWTDKVGGNNGTLVGGTYHTDGPFVGAGYVFFDGIDNIPYDYVTTSTSSDFTLGTDDFTIEFFFKSNKTGTGEGVAIAANIDSSNTGYWEIKMSPSSSQIVWADRGNTRIDVTNTNWNDDQWHHLALTREGTSVKLFFDGTQIGSTATYSYTYAGTSVVFGSKRNGSNVWKGNISNLRILKGTALYTSNFTVPTKQLTAITNTVLLTCQGNTIADASSGGHTLTANGTAAANLGFPASAFEFDGTNDYADLPNSNDFAVGTSGDITIEAWINSDDWSGDDGYVCLYQCGDLIGLSIMFALGRLRLQNWSVQFSLGSTTLSTGQWYHIVAVRKNGILTGYVNGSVENAGVSNTVNFSQNGPRIGQWKGTSLYHFDGKISGVKIYKGKGLTAEEVTQNYNATKGRYA